MLTLAILGLAFSIFAHLKVTSIEVTHEFFHARPTLNIQKILESARAKAVYRTSAEIFLILAIIMLGFTMAGGSLQLRCGGVVKYGLARDKGLSAAAAFNEASTICSDGHQMKLAQ